MNRRQAKKRFTELTGVPAKSDYVFDGIWSLEGRVPDWFNFAWNGGYISRADFDARSTEYWVSIVKYLESLQEVV